MNPLPEPNLYMAFGRPAIASVVFNPVAVVGNTLTINGVIYTYGTSWGPPQGGPYPTITSVRELANLINGQDQDSRGSLSSIPNTVIFARSSGNNLLLFAREPGTNGNSLTLATNNAAAFVLSGGNFSGGTAAPGTPNKQSSNVPSNFTIGTVGGDLFTIGSGESGFVQNLGTTALAVKQGTGASAVSLSTILAAGAANDDGKGGSLYINNWTGIVSAAAVTGSPRYIAWKV